MDDSPVPITLYVEHINFEPTIDLRFNSRRIAVDIEMDTTQVELLVNKLAERLQSRASGGGVRVRFTGRVFV